MTSTSTLSLRSATPADDGALHLLAELDSQRLHAGPYLVAEVDGRLVAAISESTGRLVADPFTRTADAVSVLREALRHRGAPAVAPRRRSLVPRLS